MPLCFGTKKQDNRQKSRSRSRLAASNIDGDMKKSKNRSRSSRVRGGSKVKGSGVRGSKVKGHEGDPVVYQSGELKKSSVSVQPIKDPDTSNLFKGSRTQKVGLKKITHQHAMYVRQQDYLTKNQNDYNVEGVCDPNKVSYKTADPEELETPPINRFFYDNDAYPIYK